MNKIIFKKLTIENFKGFANFEMEFDDTKNEIFAEFGTGKTTIIDAIKWVFGYDVNGFEPSIDGYKIKNLVTKVNLVIQKNDKDYFIERINTQKWNKENRFDKNVYGYNFDGNSKILLKDYKENIANLIGIPYETIIFFLDIKYFNEKLTLKEKNDFLYKIFDVQSIFDELAKDERFALIKEYLEKGKDDIEIQSILNTELNGNTRNGIKGIKNEKIENDTLITYNIKQVGELKKIDFESLKAEQKNIEDEISRLSTANAKQTKNAVAESKQTKISNYRLDINNIKSTYENEKNAYVLEKNKLQNGIDNDAYNINNCSEIVKKATSDLEDCQNDKEMIMETTFDENQENCSLCGQKLPQEKIQSLIANFETDKQKKIGELDEKIKMLNSRLVSNQDRVNTLTLNKNSLQANLDSLGAFPQLDNDKISALENKIATLETEIDEIKLKEARNEIAEKLTELNLKRDTILAQLVSEKELDTKTAEIQTYRDKQRELALREANIIKKQSQLNDFVNEKVRFLTEKVAFPKISFNFFKWLGANADKLYEKDCSIIYENQVYDNLSFGQKIHASYLFVNGLQKKISTDFNMPILVDEKQSVTLDLTSDSQLFEFTTRKGKGNLSAVLIKEIYCLADCDVR